MKNIKLFEEASQYEASKDGFEYPTVSYVKETAMVHYMLKLADEWVDLGLPSGLKWATCNIGATKPEEFGLFFAWGETQGYHLITDINDPNADASFDGKEFMWYSYTLCDGTQNNMTKYNATDGLTTLEAADDAATATDSSCRMPTSGECQELIDNTTSEWVSDYNDTSVAGRIFTSNVNGNSIFVPANSRSGVGENIIRMGGLWLSNLSPNDEIFATSLVFAEMGTGITDQVTRSSGLSIRAVKE